MSNAQALQSGLHAIITGSRFLGRAAFNSVVETQAGYSKNLSGIILWLYMIAPHLQTIWIFE